MSPGIILLGLLFLASKSDGAAVSTRKVADITVTKYANGYANVVSPRSDFWVIIDSSGPPSIVPDNDPKHGRRRGTAAQQNADYLLAFPRKL